MEERLRKFAKVAQTGSFTRAARELHISQPALSTAIHKLERELGAELLARSHGTLKLTDAGEAALHHAKKLDMNAANFRQRLAELAGEKPKLTIGVIDSIADALFVHDNFMPKLEAQAHVSLSVNNSRYLLQVLERAELDSALIAAPRQPINKTLHAVPLGNEPLIAVTHPGRMRTVQRTLQLGELSDFISYDQHSHTSRIIREHFINRDIELRTILYSTSPEIILHMVRANRGSAMLPYLMVREAMRQGELVPLSSPVARPIIAVQPRGRHAPKPLIELHAATRNTLQRLNREANHMLLDSDVL